MIIIAHLYRISYLYTLDTALHQSTGSYLSQYHSEVRVSGEGGLIVGECRRYTEIVDEGWASAPRGRRYSLLGLGDGRDWTEGRRRGFQYKCCLTSKVPSADRSRRFPGLVLASLSLLSQRIRSMSFGLTVRHPIAHSPLV